MAEENVLVAATTATAAGAGAGAAPRRAQTWVAPAKAVEAKCQHSQRSDHRQQNCPAYTICSSCSYTAQSDCQ